MKTIIEINGRKYDAQTGKPVGAGVKKSAPMQGKALDGVSKPKNVVAKKVPTRVRQGKVYARPTQKAKTLLRSAVKKPAALSKQPPASNAIQTKGDRGLLMRHVPEIRISRAKLIPKSMSISRFGSSTTSPKKPILKADVAVVREPKSHAAASPASSPAISQNPLASAGQVFRHSIARPLTQKRDKITSKHKAKRWRKGLRAALIAAVLCLGLSIGSFFAYQYVPSVGMRVAATQAGFSGHLPSTPAGFAFKGPVQSDKGVIKVRYASGGAQNGFVITQRPTDWNSESLLANYVNTSKDHFQTYYSKGLSVFIYNTGNATWIDKGVWYTIEGQGALSAEQVLAIASSM